MDGIIAGGMFDGQFTTPARGETTGMNGTSFDASIEGGYPFPLSHEITIEPQVQFVYQHLDFARRTDVDGIDVDLGNPNQGVFRGGVRLTKLFTADDGTLVTPYLKANLLQGLGGGDPVRLSNQPFDTGHFGTALQIGAGVTGTLTRNLSVYGDVAWQHQVSSGGFRGWALNGGIRYALGVAPLPVSGPPIPTPPLIARSYLVFFNWDHDDLTDRARQIVAEAAANFGRVQVTRIEVNGYTDTSGTRHYNQGLSVRRAKTVQGELVRDGVPEDAITIRGFGETNLLVPTGPNVRSPPNRACGDLIRLSVRMRAPGRFAFSRAPFRHRRGRNEKPPARCTISVEADPECSRKDVLSCFNRLRRALRGRCLRKMIMDEKRLRDFSGCDPLVCAKTPRITSWPGLKSRAASIPARGCAMQATRPTRSGR